MPEPKPIFKVTENGRLEYYDPKLKKWRLVEGAWTIVTTDEEATLLQGPDGNYYWIPTAGGQVVPAEEEEQEQVGEATPEEAQAKAPEGYRPVQNQSTGRWFYAPDPTKPPDQWKNPNPDRYEWVQESVSETNPDTGEPMEAQVRWVLQEKAATPASLQAEIDQLLLSGTEEDRLRAQELYDQKQQLELQSPGFKKGREDKATQERQRQLEWNMNFAATQEEKDWAARQWTADFGQKQWEASQQAQREALRLGVDISRSPADWWALENLRYGAQANRPYTGAEVAPRTWVDEWLKFAQQPQGTAPPVPRRITPPGFTPTYGEPAPPAETVAKAPAQPGAQTFPQPGQPFAPVPGSQGSPLFATEAEAKAWRVANSRVTRQADIPDLNAAWGVGAAPGTVATGGGTNNPSFVESGRASTQPSAVATGGGTNNPAFVGAEASTQPASALPPVPAQARFEAVHPQTKETAIISSNEIPGFNEAGFEIKKQVKLYDFLPYQMPGFGSGLASPLSRLPRQGVRQALFGQPVSRPRSWSTLGAPTMPSAQSWAALPWEGQQMVQSEVERLGVPWQSYAQEMASLWPSWGTPGRFRRAPTRMGFTGG